VAHGVFGDTAELEKQVAQARPPDPAARAQPTPATEGAVLVTGICGRLGRLLARELHRTDRVVGVDRRPFDDRPKDIVHHQVDMRRKKMKDIFRGRNIRAVVHLGVLHDPRRSDRERHSWNIVAFQKLLDYMSQYEVPKLVVLSGANVYGPQPNNPQFLSEDAPLLGAQHFGGMRDLVELDMLAQSFFWKHPNTETVVLRPCHIVGRVHNAASNYLRLERPVMVMGFDPMMQVVDAAFTLGSPSGWASAGRSHAPCQGRPRPALEASAQLVSFSGARSPALCLHGRRHTGPHRVGV
jgi:UDP-glucose 4-epimerase